MGAKQDKPMTTLHAASISDILDRLPRMGKVMVLGSADGITHELIAPIGEVAHRDGGFVTLHRANGHASRITLASFDRVTVDRSSRMKDKVYPRLGFMTPDGQAGFAIVGFEGLEPFDAALEGIAEERSARSEVLPGEVLPGETMAAQAGDRPVLEDSRRIRDALALAAAGEAEFTLGFEPQGDFSQFWTGKVGELKPAMGFINIIQGEFHLHVKQDAIGWWQPFPARYGKEPDGGEYGRMCLAACKPDGTLTPLRLYGPRALLEAGLA